MLTKRQYDILKYFIEHQDEFISSNTLAENFNFSSRTIKKDLSFIKIATENLESLKFEIAPGRGSKIKILDNKILISDLLNLSEKYTEVDNFNDTNLAISILEYLMNEKRYISRESILAKFYISESTFYKIYGHIKSILSNFDLKINHTKLTGYKILGTEKNKRNLIAKYELISRHNESLIQTRDISNVYDFVADTFISFQYSIDESILQNISAHIVLMDYRVRSGNNIESLDDTSAKNCIEYKISRVICQKFLDRYSLASEKFENEVILLCQTILGKINFSTDRETQEMINDFIKSSFKLIYDKFNINFEPVEKIKIYLTLHIIPLIHRINSSTQLKNPMTNKIQQQFPLANDITLYFSLLFSEKFQIEISTDELSYITLYFNLGIEELNLTTSTKEVLIITDHRNSETVLLRHKLLTWFPNQILKINFVHPDNIIDDFDKYDAILTTDLYSMKYSNTVTLVNLFPDDSDFKRVNVAINGYTDKESILDKFQEDCFFFGDVENKEELLQVICKNAIDKYSLSQDFYNKINERENIASTYFGNAVAIPHPLAPISNETFVSVALLENPIKWDEEDEVSLVLLISIEKNNPKAFQFWYYMSDIVMNNDYIEKLLLQRNFNSFISTLKLMLDKLV